jgi:hypothetical protein
VMQINDLTIQLSNPLETIETNANYTLQQMAPLVHSKIMPHRYSNILLHRSFFPDAYQMDIKALIAEKDLQGMEDYEEESDDSVSGGDSDSDLTVTTAGETDPEDINSDHGEFNEETLTMKVLNEDKATGRVMSPVLPYTPSNAPSSSPGPSSSITSTHHEDSSSDSDEESVDESFFLVLGEESDESEASEADNESEVSRFMRYTPQKIRHLERMHNLGCDSTNIRSLSGLKCLDLTTQLNSWRGVAPAVLYASSLFNAYISQGVPFVGEAHLDGSALEAMEERFRMSGDSE